MAVWLRQAVQAPHSDKQQKARLYFEVCMIGRCQLRQVATTVFHYLSCKLELRIAVRVLQICKVHFV